MVRPRRRRATKRRPRNRNRAGAQTFKLGSGITPISAIGRILTFPRKVSAKGTPDTTKWWIEGLKWAGSVVMTLITTLLTEQAFEEHRLTLAEPEKCNYTAASTVVGSVQLLRFGATDILARSPLCRTFFNKKVSDGVATVVPFRQIRLSSVSFRITPGVPITKRGGMYVVALLPITENEADSLIEADMWTFQRVARLPGAIMQSTVAPITLSYKPKRSEFAYLWKEIGGMHPEFALKLFIAYEDFSSNTADTSAEYSLTESSFHIFWRGNVQLREVSNERIVRSKPSPGLNKDQITVTGRNEPFSIHLNDCHYENGVFYHDLPTSEDPVPTPMSDDYIYA